MSWLFFLQAATALIAISVFLDKFHNSGRLNGRLSNWLRDRLVALFITLDELKIRSISPIIVRVSLPLFFISAPISLYLVVKAGQISIFLAYVNGVIIPPDCINLYAAVALSTQLIFLLVIRRISRNSSEISLSAGLLLAPVLVIGGSAAIATVTERIPNWGGVVVALSAQATYWTSMAPTLILALVFFVILFAKGAFMLSRRIILIVSSGASSPKTDPFVYFSALFAALVLIAKLIPTPWQAISAQSQEELGPAPPPAVAPSQNSTQDESKAPNR